MIKIYIYQLSKSMHLSKWICQLKLVTFLKQINISGFIYPIKPKNYLKLVNPSKLLFCFKVMYLLHQLRPQLTSWQYKTKQTLKKKITGVYIEKFLETAKVNLQDR